MERDSMIIYRSFYEAIKELPKENQADVWSAVYEFGLNGERIELTGISKTIFTLIAPQLEANYKKYLNGIKPKQKQIESKTEAKPKQKISKSEANVNVNVNDNENNNNIYRKFLHLKLTVYEFDKLRVDYSAEQINNVLDNIENFKSNKNYSSLFLTAKNWLKRDAVQKPVYESSDDALYRNVMAQIAKNEETLKNQKNAN
jgi:hydroxymethylpyrimidine pyrophosphatase-like HAD family hydrolase